MKIGFLISLALLGISTVDPVGIATMPALLTQKRPFVRSFVFLAGSFAALMLMGIIFARGFGGTLLRFEADHPQLLPSLQIAAGLVLLCFALSLLIRLRKGRSSVEPSKATLKRLQVSNGQLFGLAFALVAAESVADAVFIVAMIHTGRLDLPFDELLLAIAVYSAAAVLLQTAVVVLYRLTPQKRRAHMLRRVQAMLQRYANQTLIGISILLGLALAINGLLTFTGASHL